ncbi:MAG TPA: hypothetical protein VGC98_15755 [Thermoleophilaceae bacterium]
MQPGSRRSRTRTVAVWIAAAATLVPLVAAAPSVAVSKVKAPKSGTYTGYPGGMTLFVSGKSISFIGFSFKCGGSSGRTSLNDIKLKKAKNGYKFAIKAHGNVTYADDHPDENAAVNVSGRFSKTGKSSVGVFRVKSPRCGSTGDVKWKAFR